VIEMRIAVARTDRDEVAHFGRAQIFSIYDFDEKSYEITFLEDRKTNINPEIKHQWSLSLELINDCDLVICAQLGINAKFGLEKADIKVVQDEGTVLDVLGNYVKHYKFMNKPLFGDK
jgi:predicted Fe-Mo cluster-binding NifX family protein